LQHLYKRPLTSRSREGSWIATYDYTRIISIGRHHSCNSPIVTVVIFRNFRKLLLFGLEPGISIFRLLLLCLSSASLHVQPSLPKINQLFRRIFSSTHHIQHSTSSFQQSSSTFRPLTIKMSSSRGASMSPVDATRVHCPKCDQIMLYSTRIAVQCHDSYGYHKSRCVNCLFMEMDDCCFEVSTALLPQPQQY
jgi:hypothetical protein